MNWIRKRLSLMAVLLAIVVPIVSRAGYDNTTWGMSLVQVRRLYPGGYAREMQNGESTYSIIKPTAEQPTSVVLFTFAKKTGLGVVQIFFPEPGSKIDLKAGTYTESAVEDAISLRNSLRKRLTHKYGTPENEDDEITSWQSKSGDSITLVLKMNKTAASRATVWIMYQRPSNPDDWTEGL